MGGADEHGRNVPGENDLPGRAHTLAARHVSAAPGRGRRWAPFQGRALRLPRGNGRHTAMQTTADYAATQRGRSGMLGSF